MKAWSMARAGSSPAMPSVHWHELEVALDSWGRPSLRATWARPTAGVARDPRRCRPSRCRSPMRTRWPRAVVVIDRRAAR